MANPRDMLVYHRAKKTATRGAKVAIDQPELSIDNPDLSVSEKLAKVRVGTLVKEYLAAQELQLLGEGGMSDAIQLFVEKDDIHAIDKYISPLLSFRPLFVDFGCPSHVNKSLKKLMLNVHPNTGEVGEDELDDLVCFHSLVSKLYLIAKI